MSALLDLWMAHATQNAQSAIDPRESWAVGALMMQVNVLEPHCRCAFVGLVLGLLLFSSSSANLA